MSDKVRWGILGSANIAKKNMVPAIQEAANAELAAVASESGKAEETAADWGAPLFYQSYSTLLKDPDIDAVYIPLPNALHQKWVIEAIKNGKHVLVEKPAATTADDVIAMGAAAKEYNVKWMEAFMYQFHPQHEYVKELIADGAIGEVKRFRSTFSFPLDLSSDNIRLNKELGGGSLFDVGCYCVHASRMILDSEPSKVFSNGRLLEEDGIDISSTAILTFEGVDAVIDCSFEEAKSNRYSVSGTKGHIEVPFAYRADTNPNGGVGEVILKDVNCEVLEHKTFAADPFLIQVEHFSDCVLNDKDPVYSAESTYNNMKVIEALYQSQK
ncbi:Gfo/Idh/MocA family protein [Salisediminibacterium halotolerans]|uniref:Predicted dehydrogenase n=1 Tax=Salisediminibacterium halotolerans TaxID=517425 RepID=A0A1H9RLC9_9BACI|nr:MULTISPECIES: Gfo/Idh/MocA family oxidoreductase [Salisediminibacterium]RLJ77849.1 putative dehydrogenase [Actinophytocola xinjiangensis]RPE82804.1 putative dehydrogenase [Salisediminibacterium halotolerans]TWG36826.1 putative dehydrogenase [Salisediminibacterium halotolerans]SER73388.1 Predicted dehydrogenase [Salisediminibacterium haloalkalitolerans]GEL08732.1 oxidoreductase [Salisediminibacterium halotolerans]